MNRRGFRVAEVDHALAEIDPGADALDPLATARRLRDQARRLRTTARTPGLGRATDLIDAQDLEQRAAVLEGQAFAAPRAAANAGQ